MLALVPVPLLAQDEARDEAPLSFTASTEGGELQLHVGSLFDEPGLERALHSGLPLRIRVVAELWKDGFFVSQNGRAEWYVGGIR